MTPDAISFYLGLWVGALGMLIAEAAIVLLQGPMP